MKHDYIIKVLILFSLCLGSKMAFGQTFEPVLPHPFAGVKNGSIAFANVNVDGGRDVLIAGMDNSFNSISGHYENDGSANYTEVTGLPLLERSYKMLF